MTNRTEARTWETAIDPLERTTVSGRLVLEHAIKYVCAMDELLYNEPAANDAYEILDACLMIKVSEAKIARLRSGI